MQTMGHVDVKTAMKYQQPRARYCALGFERHGAGRATSGLVVEAGYGTLYGTPGETSLKTTGK